MFDWLKDVLYEPVPAKPVKKKPELDIKNYIKDTNYILIDSRKYPITQLSSKGVVCSNIDDTIALNEVLIITINIKDKYGNFNFNTKVEITTILKNEFKAEFLMLLPEIEAVLSKYYKLRNMK